jgi:RND family efflux transporter MFP subunit
MKKGIKTTIAVVVVAAGIVAWRCFDKSSPAAAQSGELTAVAAATATRGDVNQTIRLTAEFRPYQEIDVHAKVTGFIDSIPVDIGDQVKDGGMIATLEVPELNEDLQKANAGVEAARGEVNKAQADYQEAHLGFARLQAVATSHPKLVAQQELDDATARDQSAAAALATAKQRVEEAQAEQSREMTLVDYSKIVAPFDGVVTGRYADKGALIQAGASSAGRDSAVIRFAQENVLRLMFPVPESAVAAVKPGLPVKIEVSGLDRDIQGTVTRFAKQLNPETRTMQTEVDVPNPDLSITPGMYAWVDLTTSQHKDVVNVPLEALAGEGQQTVYIVGKDGRLQERPVTVGLETPNRAEIVHGLAEGDLVVIGSRSRLRPGQLVKPRTLDAAQLAFADK